MLITPEGENKIQKICLPNDEKDHIAYISENNFINCNQKFKVA